MEERTSRGPGGKLALWVFYAFCGYFIWAMGHYIWVISDVQSIPGATLEGEMGSTSGKWLGALLGFLVLSMSAGCWAALRGTRALVATGRKNACNLAMLGENIHSGDTQNGFNRMAAGR